MSNKQILYSAFWISPLSEKVRKASKYDYLVGRLVRRDFLCRYKRVVLEAAWTMLNPLRMMIILNIAFSQFIKAVESYPANILSGLNVWNFFAQTTNETMSGIMWGGSLLQRILFPTRFLEYR